MITLVDAISVDQPEISVYQLLNVQKQMNADTELINTDK